MHILSTKMGLAESIQEIEESINALTAKKVITDFAQYLYYNDTINDVEKDFVQILSKNLNTFLETIIIKYCKNKTKEQLIKMYVDAMLFYEHKAVSEFWNELDLIILIKKYYDSEEALLLIKKYMHNCIVEYKTDYIDSRIDSYEDIIKDYKNKSDMAIKNASELKDEIERIKKEIEALEKQKQKEHIGDLLEDTTKDFGTQTDEPINMKDVSVGTGDTDDKSVGTDDEDETKDMGVGTDVTTQDQGVGTDIKTTTETGIGDEVAVNTKDEETQI